MKLHQVTLAPAAGARIEFRPRVFSFSFHVPHLHAGGDGSSSTLARWSSMITSRLVLLRQLDPAACTQSSGGWAQEVLLVSQVCCLSSLE